MEGVHPPVAETDQEKTQRLRCWCVEQAIRVTAPNNDPLKTAEMIHDWVTKSA